MEEKVNIFSKERRMSVRNEFKWLSGMNSNGSGWELRRVLVNRATDLWV